MATKNSGNGDKHWATRFIIWNVADGTRDVTNRFTVQAHSTIPYKVILFKYLKISSLLLNYEQNFGFGLQWETLYFLEKMWIAIIISHVKNVFCSMIYHGKAHPILFERPVYLKCYKVHFSSTDSIIRYTVYKLDSLINEFLPSFFSFFLV